MTKTSRTQFTKILKYIVLKIRLINKNIFLESTGQNFANKNHSTLTQCLSSYHSSLQAIFFLLSCFVSFGNGLQLYNEQVSEKKRQIEGGGVGEASWQRTMRQITSLQVHTGGILKYYFCL